MGSAPGRQSSSLVHGWHTLWLLFSIWIFLSLEALYWETKSLGTESSDEAVGPRSWKSERCTAELNNAL